MRQETISIYRFDELSDCAKEKAREWYRSFALDHEWWDGVYDYAATIFKALGIDSYKTGRRGRSDRSPAIWFSGFSSQGDGACFEGSYRYAKDSALEVRKHTDDAEVIRIAEDLLKVQRRNFYRITASITHTGRHYHEHSTFIEVDQCSREDQEIVAELMRDLMRWIYGRLEAEHDWLMSDECVDENIVANEYEFDEDGDRA